MNNNSFLGFFGSKHKNETVNFLEHIDPEERFLDNLNKNPNWEYKDIHIEYTYNQYGHRCVDLTNLDHEYFLFTGCSFTEGIGHKLEHTYPYIVANAFNKRYYNLAVGGTGPEIVLHNLSLFLSKIQKKPKYVIIQWPVFSRFFTVENNEILRHYAGIDDSKNRFYQFYLEHPNILESKNILYRTIALQLIKNMGISGVIETFTYAPKKQYLLTDTNSSLVDPLFFDFKKPKARDMSHSGIIPQLNHANAIIEKIKFLESSHNV